MMTANPLFLFCKYVEAGSLSAASRNLNVSKSTLSKSLADLEAHLQVKLVHRSTRSFKLTEVGEEIYQHARILCDELNLIDNIAKSRNAKPFGRIRISASMPIVQHHLAHLIPEFATSYPDIVLDVVTSDQYSNLIDENIDIAIRSHSKVLENSAHLYGKQLLKDPIILVAGRKYLARNGQPELPSELQSHHGIMTANVHWQLYKNGQEAAQVQPKCRLQTNDLNVVMQAILQNLGIAAVPKSFVQKHIATGELAQVLPEMTCGDMVTTVLTTSNKNRLLAVQIFLEFLFQHVQNESVV